MPNPGYKTSAGSIVLAAAALAGCGGGGSSAPATSDVVAALKELHPDASRASCTRNGSTTYQGKKQALFRCETESDQSVKAMAPRTQCVVYVNQKLFTVRTGQNGC